MNESRGPKLSGNNQFKSATSATAVTSPTTVVVVLRADHGSRSPSQAIGPR